MTVTLTLTLTPTLTLIPRAAERGAEVDGRGRVCGGTGPISLSDGGKACRTPGAGQEEVYSNTVWYSLS